MNNSRVYTGNRYNNNTSFNLHNSSHDIVLDRQKSNTRHFTVNETISTYSARNILKNMLIILSIVVFISIFSIILVQGSNKETPDTLNKYYKSITIEQDDTLWNLADTYNSGVEDKDSYINCVKTLNNMTSDTLYAGESLVIYYYSSQIQ